MGKKCIKCGYERTESDDFVPDYECPKCGIIYAKVESKLNANNLDKHNLSDEEKINLIKAKASQSKDLEINTTTKCPYCNEEIKADAIKCKHCKSMINKGTYSKNLNKKKSPFRYILYIFVGIIGLFIVGVFMGITSEPYQKYQAKKLGNNSNSIMQTIEDQVARDAVKQFNIAYDYGSDIDKCVQAGMVSAAFLQAKDVANYKSWKEREDTLCYLAGIRDL